MAKKAAQLIVLPSLDFNIDALSPSIAAGAGGVLFLGGAPAPPDLAARIAQARSLVPPGTAFVTMADEEGGGVQRLGNLVGSLPWPRQMAADYSTAQVTAMATAMARKMRSAGVNMDLAPVLDVDGGVGPSSSNPDGLRSFSALPTVAGLYGDAFIQGLEAGGVIPVAKHFPGLGGSSANTDYGPARTQPLSVLQSGGLVPFRIALAHGLGAIMVSNAIVPGLTSVPASVSPVAIDGQLRTTMGFRGLVLTDSLSSRAIIQAGYTLQSAAVASIEAGADMILFGSTLTPADTAAQLPAHVAFVFNSMVDALVRAVQAGSLSQARLNQAVLHVLSATGARLSCAALRGPP